MVKILPLTLALFSTSWRGDICIVKSTDKKENQIFLIYKETQNGAVYKVIWLTASYIWGNICAFPHILGSPSSYLTLQLLRSEVPYIWRKFDFIFYQWGFLLIGEDPVWTGRGDPHSEHVHQQSQQSLGAGNHTAGSSLRVINLTWALLFIVGVHIGARTLHVQNLIWFGNIARLSQWGGVGYSHVQMISVTVLEEKGRGSAPCGSSTLNVMNKFGRELSVTSLENSWSGTPLYSSLLVLGLEKPLNRGIYLFIFLHTLFNTASSAPLRFHCVGGCWG
jgi:hypothetical protein